MGRKFFFCLPRHDQSKTNGNITLTLGTLGCIACLTFGPEFINALWQNNPHSNFQQIMKRIVAGTYASIFIELQWADPFCNHALPPRKIQTRFAVLAIHCATLQLCTLNSLSRIKSQLGQVPSRGAGLFKDEILQVVQHDPTSLTTDFKSIALFTNIQDFLHARCEKSWPEVKNLPVAWPRD